MKSVEKAIDIMIILIMFMITIKFIVIPVRDKVCNAADKVATTMDKWKGGEEFENTDTGRNQYDVFRTIEQGNFKNVKTVEQELAELTGLRK